MKALQGSTNQEFVFHESGSGPRSRQLPARFFHRWASGVKRGFPW